MAVSRGGARPRCWKPGLGFVCKASGWAGPPALSPGGEAAWLPPPRRPAAAFSPSLAVRWVQAWPPAPRRRLGADVGWREAARRGRWVCCFGSQIAVWPKIKEKKQTNRKKTPDPGTEVSTNRASKMLGTLASDLYVSFPFSGPVTPHGSRVFTTASSFVQSEPKLMCPFPHRNAFKCI